MEERLRHAAQGAEMVREAGEATQEEKRSRLTEMGLQSGFHVQMLSKPGAPDSGDEDEARALTTQEIENHVTSQSVDGEVPGDLTPLYSETQRTEPADLPEPRTVEAVCEAGRGSS